MPVAKVNSASVVGLNPYLVTVEVAIDKRGFPGFTIVGLAAKEVDEAKERVRNAILSAGFDFPKHRITVNLAPADLPKKGSAFDLPIAIGIIAAFINEDYPKAQVTADLSKKLFLGELSLDGNLRPAWGVLPISIFARENGFTHIYLPDENKSEASIVDKINVISVKSFYELVNHLEGEAIIYKEDTLDFESILEKEEDYELDIKDIIGQETAKRALEVAASGAHNIAMEGPPGSGKTMLARALPSILPSLITDEAFELTKIYSVAGLLNHDRPYVSKRPFRSPHHTTSRTGLIGGGSKITPGEISLAHRGVLFLDEFPELPRAVLESLRQPLEDGVVTISRASGSLMFPANFMLVAAMNPCPCGNLGSIKKVCKCSAYEVLTYKKRVSGPILDRIDIHINVPLVDIEKISENTNSNKENSSDIKKRVQKARNIQKERFKNTNLVANSDMGVKDIKKFVKLTDEAKKFLTYASLKNSFSARGYFKIVKTAQTIADLDESSFVELNHVTEAVSYRLREG